MKNILVATDFSTVSDNAILYASKMANVLDATLILFHAYKPDSPFPSIDLGISNFGVMTETKQKMQDEAKRILTDLASNMEIICEVGDAKETIINIVKEKNVDLVIMGMKGKGNNIKKVFGSTVTSLMSDIPVPLLVIPNEAIFGTINTIAFANDEIDSELVKETTHFKMFKHVFNANIFIVHVIKDTDEVKMKFSEISEIEKLYDVTYKFPVGNDVGEALNNFIKENDVKMLVMSPHKHTWSEMLFGKSETKNMIFHSHIPLLILPNLYN